MSGSRSIAVAYGVSGAVAVAAQFSLARMTLVSLSGSELGAGMFLSFWVLSGGLGCLLSSPLARSHRPPATTFCLLLLLLGLLTPAWCFLIVGARGLLFGPSLSLPLGRAMALAAIAAFPVSFVLGMLFAVALRAAPGSARAPPLLYLADAAGSCAGGLLASFVLAPLLPTLSIALIAAAVVLGTAAVLSAGRGGGRAVTVVSAVAALAAAAPVLHPGAREATATALARMRFPGAEVAAHVDSRHQSFTALRSRESLSLYQNGALTFFSQAGEREEEVAHLALACLPEPERVLVIGSGWPFLPREILKHPVSALDLIVEDADVHRAGIAALPAELAAVLDDPRLRVRYGDPQEMLGGPGRYDAVFIDIGLPDTLLAARLVTLELLGRLGGLLADGGVVALAAPSVESYLSPALLNLNATLLATLRQALGDAEAIPGQYAGNILIAGRDVALELFTADALADRIESRGVVARWMNRHSLATVLDVHRRRDLELRLTEAGGVLNTAENPVALLWSLEYRQELAGGKVSIASLRDIRARHVALALLGLAVVLVAIQRASGRDLTAPACAAAAGFAAMVAELSLLCAFQVAFGNLYSVMAALVGLTMAGIAAGSAAAPAIRRRAPMAGKRLTLAGFFALGLATAIAIAALAPGLLARPGRLSMSVIGAAMVLTGFCSGGAVSLLLERDQMADTAPPAITYGADLLGGAVGGALVSTLLLPVLGITSSLWLIAAGYGFALLVLADSGSPTGGHAGVRRLP